MTTIAQTLATLRRRPMRTFLTALGTALGIATIVALLAVAGGAQRSASHLLNLGPGDVGLFQKDAADLTTSVLPTSLVPRVQRTPGIANATPMLLMTGDVRHQPGTIVFGAQAPTFVTRAYVFSSGGIFTAPHQAIVGSDLAATMHLKVGDPFVVSGQKFTISGIYHIGVAEQDNGAVIPLATAQAIMGREGEATTFAVHLDPTVSLTTATRTIMKRFPGMLVVGTPGEAARAGANTQLLSKVALVIAVLALIIGGIGVMNTMLMAVIERRSEFALLSAVGWSGPQIATRVIVEGIATAVLGAGIGLLLGTVGAQLLVNALGAGGFVAPDVTAWDLGRALLVGVLLGVLGGLYPAWRASHLSPAQVLASR